MKKIMLILTAILCLTLGARASYAEGTEFLGTWYYATYEDSETYPGTAFTADGGSRYLSVYTDGENLLLVDNRDGRKNDARKATVEGDVLTAGSEKFTLEDGKLICRYGAVTETYTREPQEQQVPADQTAAYADELKPEHYNGTWTIVKYGTRNAFADAEAMNMTGEAVIEDGKITVTWTRDGQEKSFEITFDAELNKGRLYTVVNGTRSYIISMRADHTVLLNIGLNESQWVMRKENVISEEVVHLLAPDFENAFAAREDWTASEETRDGLAGLLIGTAMAGGVDPAAVREDSPAFLAMVSKESAYPVLICEGTGAYENYLLTIGRGIDRETGEVFVYYHWTDRFFSSLLHPEQSIADNYADEVLRLVAGEQIWPVRAEAGIR